MCITEISKYAAHDATATAVQAIRFFAVFAQPFFQDGFAAGKLPLVVRAFPPPGHAK